MLLYVLSQAHIQIKPMLYFVFNLNVFEHWAFTLLNKKIILFKDCRLLILPFENQNANILVFILQLCLFYNCFISFVICNVKTIIIVGIKTQDEAITDAKSFCVIYWSAYKQPCFFCVKVDLRLKTNIHEIKQC